MPIVHSYDCATGQHAPPLGAATNEGLNVLLKKLEVDLGTSHRAAGCRGCGRVFTSVTAFDMHQRLQRGGIVCLLPADVGLERKPNGHWGKKMDERQRARLAHLHYRTRASSPVVNALVSSGGQAC